MNFKALYHKYKSKYIKLKKNSLKGGGISNASIFLMTDIPNKNGTAVKHVVLLMNRIMNRGVLSGFKYSLPGGQLDRTENPFKAMKREYMEETGSILPQLSSFQKNNLAKLNYNGHTRIYIANCNYNEIAYYPRNVKNYETCGLILFPCEQLKIQLDTGNSVNEYPFINLRHCQIKSTEQIFNEYLDSKFNIKKSDE